MEEQDERYKVMLEDASMKLKAENDKLRAEVEALKDDKALLTGQLQQSRKHVADADLKVVELRTVIESMGCQCARSIDSKVKFTCLRCSALDKLAGR